MLIAMYMYDRYLDIVLWIRYPTLPIKEQKTKTPVHQK